MKEAAKAELIRQQKRENSLGHKFVKGLKSFFTKMVEEEE